MIDVKNINELLTYKEKLEKSVRGSETNNKKHFELQRGDIWEAHISGIGSEQDGIRPVIIYQNPLGNKYSPTTIVIPVTSQQTKSKLPTHVEIKGYGLQKDSVALVEQIRVLDKKCRLIKYIGHIDSDFMKKIDRADNISKCEYIRPIDRLQDEEIREIIEDKLDKIRSYEIVLSNSENSDFMNHCLRSRQLELEELQEFCTENSLNYRNYYIKYNPKIERVKSAVI